MEFEKSEALSQLYTFYGVLLTQRQQQFFEDYYYRDFSLAEIASNYNVSRQAVFDHLHRATDQLQYYEAKLHQKAEYDQLDAGMSEILRKLTQNDVASAITKLKELQDLIQED